MKIFSSSNNNDIEIKSPSNKNLFENFKNNSKEKQKNKYFKDDEYRIKLKNTIDVILIFQF